MLKIEVFVWFTVNWFSSKCDNRGRFPNSGHLSMTENVFKTRRCPLFRGFTVSSKNNSRSLRGVTIVLMLLTPRCVTKQREVSINISKVTVGVKQSISRRTTFSPYLYLKEKEALKYLPIFQR